MLAPCVYPTFASSAANDQTALADGREYCIAVGMLEIIPALAGILEDLDGVRILVPLGESRCQRHCQKQQKCTDSHV